MPINEVEHERIEAAVRDAEARTSAEIVCVLARASSEHAYAPLVWAAALALATPWPMLALTDWSAQRMFLTQLAVFVVGAAFASFGPWRAHLVAWLTPRAAQRASVERAAREQFHVLGLRRTQGRTGVLIYVSLAERIARIIPDDAVAARIDPQVWRSAVEQLIERVKAEDVAGGFVAAVACCAQALEPHFPPAPADVNELPDRVRLV